MVGGGADVATAPGVVSHNIRGLSYDIKKSFFQHHFQKSKLSAINQAVGVSTIEKPVLINLQEINVNIPNFKTFNPFYGFKPVIQSYSNLIPRINGVMSFIRSDITILQQEVIVEGRVTCIVFLYDNVKYAGINVYLPTKEHNILFPNDSYNNSMTKLTVFMHSLKISYPDICFLLSGDFNASLETHSQKQFMLITLLVEFTLYDYFSTILNIHAPTWRGSGNSCGSSSRIDFFFTSVKTGWEHGSMIPAPDSDHKVLILGKERDPAPPPPLKWDQYILKNDAFIKEFVSSLAFKLSENPDSSVDHIDLVLEWDGAAPEDSAPLRTFDFLIKHLEAKYRNFKAGKSVNSRRAQTQYVRSIEELERRIEAAARNNSNFSASAEELTKMKKQRRDEINREYRDALHFRALESARDYGKNTRKAFQSTSRKTRTGIKNLKRPDNSLTSDPEEIASIMTNHHKTNTGSSFTPPAERGIAGAQVTTNGYLSFGDFSDLLNSEGFDMREQLPKLQLNDTIFSKTEITYVLSKMKAKAAPGPSGISKFVLTFFAKLFPKFFSKLVNFVSQNPEILVQPENQWIKHRNIIFLLKKGADPLYAKSYRPISLLESFYKLISKLYLERISPNQESLFSPSQHGFIRGRQMANASYSIISSINYAKLNKLSCQVISLDIKAAFDRVNPDIINELLKLIFPDNSQFISNFNALVTGGSACTLTTLEGAVFYLLYGTGQGDPSSGARFLTAHYIFDMFLNFDANRHGYRLRAGGRDMINTSFADDTATALCLGSGNHIDRLLRVFEIIKPMGLEINPLKTRILSFKSKNEVQNRLSEVGLVVQHFTHLGIEISFDLDLAYKSTYEISMARLEKSSCIFNRVYSSNHIHRAMLVKSILYSLFYHVFRIFPPEKKEADKIYRKMRKTLWSFPNMNQDGTLSTRRTHIAKSRLGAPIVQGGLDMKEVTVVASWVYFKSAARFYQWTQTNDSLYTSHTAPMSTHAFHAGSKQMSGLWKFLSRISRPTQQAKYDIRKAVSELESDPRYFLASALSYSKHHTFMSPSMAVLEQIPEPHCVYTVLAKSADGKPFPWLAPQFSAIPGFSGITKQVVKRLHELFPDSFTNQDYQTETVPFLYPRDSLLKLILGKPEIMVSKMKEIANSSFPPVPPAYRTRIRDDVDRPHDVSQFLESYRTAVKLKLDTYTLSFQLKFLNRTAWSRSKAFKSGIVESNQCERCQDISTTEHHLSECSMPRAFLQIFENFTRADDKYRNLEVNEMTYLFLIRRGRVTRKIENQAFQLYSRIKTASMHLWRQERFTAWADLVFIAKILTTTHNLQQFLQFTRQPRNLILDFEAYLRDHSVNLVLDLHVRI